MDRSPRSPAEPAFAHGHHFAPPLRLSTGELAAQAWRGSFEGVRSSYDSRVAMRVPAGLRGALYRNGPALFNFGGTAGRHWLEGDGLVHVFRFLGGAVQHSARLVLTDKLRAEVQAGRRLHEDAAAANTANGSTLLMGGELLALWEGGAPHVLSPSTLGTRGCKRWAGVEAGLPFSSHPRVDSDGSVWNFGCLPGRDRLALYRFDAAGALLQHAYVDGRGLDLVHDMALTDRWAVFFSPPCRWTGCVSGSDCSARHRWQADEPTRVLVMDKATLTVKARFELPACGLFHLGPAREQGSILHVGAAVYEDLPAFWRLAGEAMSNARVHWPRTRWVEFELDLATQRARSQVAHDDTVEFPREAAAGSGRVVLLAAKPDPWQTVFGFNAVQVLDVAGGRLDEYRFPAHWIVEEHVFVPGPGAGGWLLGTAYDWVRRRTAINVFDAARLSEGPLQQAMLPYGLPLGLHGQFYPA